MPHRVVGKSRTLDHRGDIDDMFPVSRAIRTVVFPESRSDSIRTWLRHHAVADAMGPCVISLNRKASGTAALDCEQHRVVTAGAAIFQIADTVVVLSFIRVQQSQN